MRVLVVEDYEPLARSLVRGLREAGYAVDGCADGEEALSLAESSAYDGIVLDLTLPRVDGLALLRLLRKGGHPAGLLVLTARDSVAAKVEVLDAGADDCLIKPFAFDELLARLRTVIRRRYQVPDSVIRIADLEVDTAARSVRRGGVTVTLSAREYAVLEYLALRRGQIVTRAEIWAHIYDLASDPSSNVVDVYVGYLRKKIDLDRAPKLIHTRRGQGYLLAREA